MTHFLDGPAKGKNLALRRRPLYLRVTMKGSECDALDLPSDEPRPGEQLFAYKLDPNSMQGFACTGKGCYPISEYRFIPEQPPQSVMLSLREWQNWVENHYSRSHTQGL